MVGANPLFGKETVATVCKKNTVQKVGGSSAGFGSYVEQTNFELDS